MIKNLFQITHIDLCSHHLRSSAALISLDSAAFCSTCKSSDGLLQKLTAVRLTQTCLRRPFRDCTHPMTTCELRLLPGKPPESGRVERSGTRQHAGRRGLTPPLPERRNGARRKHLRTGETRERLAAGRPR